MSYIHRLIDGLHGLLAPPGDICLVCGRRTKISKEYAGICTSCAARIPWISNPRCRYCGRAYGCPDCIRNGEMERSFVCNRSAVMYNESMREILAQYKYRGNEKYSTVLVSMLSHAYRLLLHEVFTSNSRTTKHGPFDGVIYVPVSSIRLAERGFNQAEQLAAGLATEHRIPLMSLLERKEHTEKQSFKTRQQRINSMQQAFITNTYVVEDLARHWLHTQQHDVEQRANAAMQLLLIDDIYTTGSTINACATVVKDSFLQLGVLVEIYSLTWARS
ncbi:putative amidophosphoribosyltransferase [Paenibacillus sp. DS2015]|uniref:ComF family protein n=1 Tax=Paenibacillus sp. DS2015 TaxID=3373917 RepID=UPI003D237758